MFAYELDAIAEELDSPDPLEFVALDVKQDYFKDTGSVARPLVVRD